MVVCVGEEGGCGRGERKEEATVDVSIGTCDESTTPGSSFDRIERVHGMNHDEPFSRGRNSLAGLALQIWSSLTFWAKVLVPSQWP
jgi:hypothetical protein